jgi:formylglycine-generating enzyme required for sulfatase activity
MAGGVETTGGVVATGGVVVTGGTTTAGGKPNDPRCPGTGGPSMVMLPEGYCIDSTEVTRAQYQAWLDTNPPLPDSSDPDCGWNMTFAPDTACMSSTTVCHTDCDQHPQVCVDWCDAYAFCRGVGERLCGRIRGGSNEYTAYADASSSQWYNACVSDGVSNTFPYGNSYQPGYCNGGDHGVLTTVPVGSMTTCQSSVPDYEGVYDLLGNVAEWEDSCDGFGKSATCRTRGGCYALLGSVTCDDGISGFRYGSYAIFGFRCCS